MGSRRRTPKDRGKRSEARAWTSDVSKRELAHELAERLTQEIRDADDLESCGAQPPAIGTTTALADHCPPLASRRGVAHPEP
jgi:hypothetical protein